MTVVFPIGGKGDRFVKAGYTVPKPFIMLNGKSLLAHAIGSYPKDAHFIFFVRPEYREEVGNIARAFLKSGTFVVVIPKETKGPIETILLGSILTEIKGEVLFADCDSALSLTEVESALDLFRTSKADGGVTIRSTKDPDCSYCIFDSDRWVLKTKEKDRYFLLNDTDLFSKWSTTGPYWWKDFGTFVECASKAVGDGITSVSPVYNYLIQGGGKVKAFPVATFRHFGTPEALRAVDSSA